MTQLLRKLNNPEIDKIKISSQDHFELVYLRHRYFRKSTNPKPGRLEQFEEMIGNISNKIYMRNIEVFKTVGFEMDDLQNIARIHTVSFITMSGLEENPDKMEVFIQRHKKKYGQNSNPDKRDIFRKECYDLARFLNQRIQEVAKFSKIKNSNIRGTKSQKKFYVGDSTRFPSDIDLFNYPEVYGYKKITEKKFKELEKENNAKGKREFINKQNQMVRVVYIKGSFLNEQDIYDMDIDPRDNSYYKDPQDNMIQNEEVLLENFILNY